MVTMRKHWLTWKCVGFLALGITACGGSNNSGGGNTQNPPPPPPQTLTGVFVDGPVENLRYETQTQSGYTNSEGEFTYLEGENVAFFVGDIAIGEADAAAEISPFDLVGMAAPTTAPEIVQVRRQLGDGKAFDQVINTTVFLQTLDADSDLSNSIQIPEQMHTLAAGRSLNFEQSSFEFSETFSLRQLIAEGRNEGLWGGVKKIRDPGLALDTLYSGLELMPEILMMSKEEFDYGNDGTLDFIELFTYSTTNNNWVAEYDAYVNGTDQTQILTFSDNGDTVSYEVIDYIDGSADLHNTATYDDNGNRVTMAKDANGDGSNEEIIHNEYDANGSLIFQAVDSDGDGSINHHRHLNYDEQGKLVLRETDSGADGDIDQRFNYTYDDNGNLILEVWELEIGGEFVETSIYTYDYDGNGNRTLSSDDFNASGIVDSFQTWQYNANNNLLLQELYITDDEVADVRYVYEYDANGNRILYETDNDADGVVDHREVYSYDANGNFTGVTRDADGDGDVDYIRVVTYDNNQSRIVEEIDYDGDGTVENRYAYTYTNISWYFLWRWYTSEKLDGDSCGLRRDTNVHKTECPVKL